MLLASCSHNSNVRVDWGAMAGHPTPPHIIGALKWWLLSLNRPPSLSNGWPFSVPGSSVASYLKSQSGARSPRNSQRRTASISYRKFTWQTFRLEGLVVLCVLLFAFLVLQSSIILLLVHFPAWPTTPVNIFRFQHNTSLWLASGGKRHRILTVNDPGEIIPGRRDWLPNFRVPLATFCNN
jgi:hypothetical protein